MATLDKNGLSYFWNKLKSKFANITHTHAISEVTSLQDALDNKAASKHTHVVADVTDLQTALNKKLDATTTAATDIQIDDEILIRRNNTTYSYTPELLKSYMNFPLLWKRTYTGSGNPNYYSICYADNLFLAFGNSDYIYVSSDYGDTWTTQSLFPDSDLSYIRSICYGNGYFVGVTNTGDVIYTTQQSSIDSWSYKTSVNGSALFDVCYGDGKFIAVGYGGKGYYSTNNGQSWSTISNMQFSTQSIQSVCYAEGKFVAVGNYGRISYSTNGTSWTNASLEDTSHLYSVCYGNGRFVAVGYDVVYSDDGIHWNHSSSLPNVTGYKAYNGVYHSNGVFVAVGADGISAYSTNGQEWTAIPVLKALSPNRSYRAVCYGNGRFVVVGETSIYRSI